MASLVSTVCSASSSPLEELSTPSLIEREGASTQETMMCPHMIDPVVVLSNLPRPPVPILPKLMIGLDRDA